MDYGFWIRWKGGKMTPDEKQILSKVERALPHYPLSVIMKSYLVCGILTASHLPSLNAAARNKLEKPVIRHYMANKNLTVEEASGLTNVELT